jgi:hypothetical protein
MFFGGRAALCLPHARQVRPWGIDMVAAAGIFSLESDLGLHHVHVGHVIVF